MKKAASLRSQLKQFHKCFSTRLLGSRSAFCSPAISLLLLSRFSRVWLCVTPQMAAHQAPPPLVSSRQEHWSGLPFPSPMHESETWKWSRVLLFTTPWTAAYQAPPSMGFSRQEYQSGLPLPSLGHFTTEYQKAIKKKKSSRAERERN